MKQIKDNFGELGAKYSHHGLHPICADLAPQRSSILGVGGFGPGVPFLIHLPLHIHQHLERSQQKRWKDSKSQSPKVHWL